MRTAVKLFVILALVSGGCAARTTTSTPPEDPACRVAYQWGERVADGLLEEREETDDSAAPETAPVPEKADPSLVARYYPAGGEMARCFEEGYAGRMQPDDQQNPDDQNPDGEDTSALKVLLWVVLAPFAILLCAGSGDFSTCMDGLFSRDQLLDTP
jgi:hypothetical protein